MITFGKTTILWDGIFYNPHPPTWQTREDYCVDKGFGLLKGKSSCIRRWWWDARRWRTPAAPPARRGQTPSASPANFSSSLSSFPADQSPDFLLQSDQREQRSWLVKQEQPMCSRQQPSWLSPGTNRSLLGPRPSEVGLNYASSWERRKWPLWVMHSLVAGARLYLPRGCLIVIS